MRKIDEDTILKIGDHLLWENEGERLERCGEFSVVVILRYGTLPSDEFFYLNIPGTDIDQYMDRQTIRSNSRLLEIEKEPEYFLWV